MLRQGAGEPLVYALAHAQPNTPDLGVLFRRPDQQLHHLGVVTDQAGMAAAAACTAAAACLRTLADPVASAQC